MRLTETADEIVARDQPNWSCSGSMITLGAARNDPAPTSATNEIAATHHARWIRLIGGALRIHEAEVVPVDIGECDRPCTGGAVAACRAEREEVIECDLRARSRCRGDVEVEPLLAELRHQRRPAPGEL